MEQKIRLACPLNKKWDNCKSCRKTSCKRYRPFKDMSFSQFLRLPALFPNGFPVHRERALPKTKYQPEDEENVEE